MTPQEIVQKLDKMIREDAKRPPLEQVRDLIEAGVIDNQGRVLIGGGAKPKKKPKTDKKKGKDKK
jgi:hypothetical protein